MSCGENFINSIYPKLNNLAKKDTSLSTQYFDRLVTAHQFRTMFTAIKDFVPPGVKVLDWGCGLGHISYCLDDLGYKTSAFTLQDRPPLIDFMIQKQGKSVDFKKGDESDPIRLPFQNESFECVLSCGVLEHVRECGGAELASMGEIKRVLKKGGLFICAHFPNKYGLTYFFAKARAPKTEREVPYTIGYHKYTYGKGDVLKLCDQSGLQVIHYSRYNFFPRNIFLSLGDTVGDNHGIAKTINIFDSVIESVCPFICTSHLFIAKKK